MNWRRTKAASEKPSNQNRTWAVPVILEIDGEEVRLALYVEARTQKQSRKKAMRIFDRLANGGFATIADGS